LVVDEALELLAHSRVGSKLSIRREDGDPLRRLEGLGVILDVPHAGRAVLRLAACAACGVEVELIRRRVGTEQGGEVDLVEALVLEELEEFGGWGVDIG
jgi:hypothetical protein